MSMNIMLDLETWGTTPSSDIRSIGACVFDPDSGLVHDGSLGTIKPFYIALDNPALDVSLWPDDHMYESHFWDEGNQIYRKYPLMRDPKTVKWWSEQSSEAQSAFTDPVGVYPLPPSDVLCHKKPLPERGINEKFREQTYLRCYHTGTRRLCFSWFRAAWRFGYCLFNRRGQAGRLRECSRG